MSSFGTFNTGHDVAIEIVDPATGVPLLIPIKTGWEKKQRTEQVKSKPLNAPPIFEEDPDGWEGSFDIDRSNSVVDDFFAAREEQFYGGQTIRQATILETMQEVGGGFTQWRYTGVALKLDDAGKAERGKTIVLKIAFAAGRRIKVQ
ncbi:MAG: hypothetical protein K2Y56_24040 [Methylobacterium sp.]|uniref:hypothetical protein n=1 Tax=Methylobacterium sp. TaxID=409 RepID=UPI0025D75C30|nr:hypothetical protein [Methylobacterium sp.]MBX9934549.1 hypothetical protein [Methylobacterium sp.]